jgi:hypothetical protein
MEYQRLVASSGEAELQWVKKLSSALRTAGAFPLQRNRQPSAKTLSNLENRYCR